ncbi:Alanine racemase [Caloramator mitchellensis]|uniref:Alanine racemase n=1 Tax=Caloramator mitchellensis TaxID=908809 RepID=A0A0R3JVN0_CALMK|nr:alanine racemase [Caloramator mitchellensis]KRQ87130.1 Alanine racemase [Caloramator mitchellensis]
MFKEIRPYYAEINLDNFRHNVREVKRLVKGRNIFGVIKADGYGHGAAELARVLREEGVDYFAVAVITEALELRKYGFNEPILVMGYTPSTFAKQIVENDITQAVFSYESAKALSDEAVKLNKEVKIHIKVDTGMGRVGFLPCESSIQDIINISKLRNIKLEGIFSHFSSADESDKKFSFEQLNKFNQFLDELKTKGVTFDIKHMANSAAIIDIEDSYFDAVRPGIMLYGYYPSKEVNIDKVDLKPVMTLKANIVHLKEVDAGTPISYGRKFYTARKSKIATLPLGYADGFTRLLFNKINVIVNDKLVPVVGRICMDQCMIDVTDCQDIKVGDEVIVMGNTENIKNDADVFAEYLGTINYEILCMVSKRVPRVYFENGNIVKIKNYV